MPDKRDGYVAGAELWLSITDPGAFRPKPPHSWIRRVGLLDRKPPRITRYSLSADCGQTGLHGLGGTGVVFKIALAVTDDNLMSADSGVKSISVLPLSMTPEGVGWLPASSAAWELTPEERQRSAGDSVQHVLEVAVSCDNLDADREIVCGLVLNDMTYNAEARLITLQVPADVLERCCKRGDRH